MPAARYAPLPNPHTDPHAQNEMEAAFLDSDDELDEEEDEQPQTGHSRHGYHSLPHSDPLASPTSPSSPSPLSTHDARARTDGTYDFENVDYDADWTLRPPPGPAAPPPPSLCAACARAAVTRTAWCLILVRQRSSSRGARGEEGSAQDGGSGESCQRASRTGWGSQRRKGQAAAVGARWEGG